jgi:hypothetical protein
MIAKNQMSSSDEVEMRGACFRRVCRVLLALALVLVLEPALVLELVLVLVLVPAPALALPYTFEPETGQEVQEVQFEPAKLWKTWFANKLSCVPA